MKTHGCIASLAAISWSRVLRRAAPIGIGATLALSAQAQTYTWTQGCDGPMSAQLAIDFGLIEWQVCLEQRGIKGVWIANASVRRPDEASFTRVLDGAGPAEIFVAYNGGPFWDPNAAPRLYDMNPYAVLDAVSDVDLPRDGVASLETLSGDNKPRVVVELRDLGPAWLDKHHQGAYRNRARRLLEVVAWSVYDAGNYDYVVQYGFRNDGTITLRVGATGYNNPSDPTQGHMHNVLWHVHFNLFGDNVDRVDSSTHVDGPGAQAKDVAITLVPEQFNDISANVANFIRATIVDGAHPNFHGNDPGYEVSPFNFEGLARHYGPNEAWTQWDAGISQWNASELGWQTTHVTPPDLYVYGYPVGTADAFVTDPVVWVRTSIYHDPHDEDRSKNDLPCGVTGITGIHWTGLDLEPRNFFEFNPVGGEASSSFAPLPDGCVSWWKFDESEVVGVTTETDDAIANVSGTMSGGAAIGPGLHGGGILLDGINDWVEPTASPSYLDMIGPDFTIEGFVNVASGSTGIQAILEKRVPFSAGYTLFLRNGQISLQLSRAGTWVNYVSTTAVPTNQIAHVACVVHRSAASPQVRFYVNGVLTPDSPFAVSLTLLGSLANPAIARIGQHAGGGKFYKGMLDDFAVYTRALTPEEIARIAASGGKSGGR